MCRGVGAFQTGSINVAASSVVLLLVAVPIPQCDITLITMSSTRNPFDILKEQAVKASQPVAASRPRRDAGSSIGGAPQRGTSLVWRDADGNIKKWFVWGKHSFDDPDAIFM